MDYWEVWRNSRTGMISYFIYCFASFIMDCFQAYVGLVQTTVTNSGQHSLVLDSINKCSLFALQFLHNYIALLVGDRFELLTSVKYLLICMSDLYQTGLFSDDKAPKLSFLYSLCRLYTLSSIKVKHSSGGTANKAVQWLILLRMLGTCLKISATQFSEPPKVIVEPTLPDQLNEETSNVMCFVCRNHSSYLSALLCGHVFCWECCIVSMRDSARCPLCRSPCTASEIRYLQNYC